MFKHILLPTDGSRLSEQAVFNGIEIARVHSAKVTGVHAAPEFHVLSYRAADLIESREQFGQDVRAHAERSLDFVRGAASEAKEPCETVIEQSDHPHDAICKAAKRSHCDLIFMASHGKRGLISALLGSETQRVLAHSDLPVMVWRETTP